MQIRALGWFFCGDAAAALTTNSLHTCHPHGPGLLDPLPSNHMPCCNDRAAPSLPGSRLVDSIQGTFWPRLCSVLIINPVCAQEPSWHS
jgi:hypothetical protein